VLDAKPVKAVHDHPQYNDITDSAASSDDEAGGVKKKKVRVGARPVRMESAGGG
jgi:hypothetical protein